MKPDARAGLPGPVPVEALAALRRAGRIAAQARAFGAQSIRAGSRVRDVCEAVDRQIERLGGQLAFPTQSSRNEIAAHYCPSPDDPTLYEDGDLAKLDIGVHVDGWVVDTATTVNLGELPEHRPFVEAAQAALEAAIAVAGPGVAIRQLSEAIEAQLSARGLRAMKNLCGHGVGRFTVHCPPPIPNTSEASQGQLVPGSVVAIEPFATDGLGLVAEAGPAEVFRLLPGRDDAGGLDAEVFGAIRALQGLPFARRQLARFGGSRVEATLKTLWGRGWVAAYPPLKEAAGRPVAQAEHTLWIGSEGVEVLTR